jgi:hypothetical protein
MGSEDRDYLIPCCRALILDDHEVQSAMILDCHDDLRDDKGRELTSLVVYRFTYTYIHTHGTPASPSDMPSVLVAAGLFVERMNEFFPANQRRVTPKYLWAPFRPRVEGDKPSRYCFIENRGGLKYHRNYDGGLLGGFGLRTPLLPS